MSLAFVGKRKGLLHSTAEVDQRGPAPPWRKGRSFSGMRYTHRYSCCLDVLRLAYLFTQESYLPNYTTTKATSMERYHNMHFYLF